MESSTDKDKETSPSEEEEDIEEEEASDDDDSGDDTPPSPEFGKFPRTTLRYCTSSSIMKCCTSLFESSRRAYSSISEQSLELYYDDTLTLSSERTQITNQSNNTEQSQQNPDDQQ